jgi:hypothetical protein
MDTSDFAKRLAEKLIEQLKEGTAPWQQPWEAGQMLSPYNPTRSITLAHSWPRPMPPANRDIVGSFWKAILMSRVIRFEMPFAGLLTWTRPVISIGRFGLGTRPFLQRPLNIGKAPSHHTDDCEVARRTSQRLGTSRDIEYRIRGDELCSELLAGGVDELRKTAHDEFVGFCCHKWYF